MHRIPFKALCVLAALSACDPRASAQDQPALNARAQVTPREMTRLIFFSRGPDGFALPAQVVFQYGQPAWKADYDETIKGAKAGMRARLGKDFWSTLDTNRDLTIGGKAVPAGSYYLAIEKVDDQTMNLVLLDPAEIRKQHLDAFMAEKATGGIPVPMQWEKTEKATELQSLRLQSGKDPREATFEILWGNHRLSAPLTVKL